jgi:hypothetical protein
LKPGDHIAVGRPWGYSHHGIYVGDERVIQFGGQISDKPGATIGAVTLDEFARGGRVRAIVHRPLKSDGWQLREAERADRAIGKAEWLLEQHNQWLGDRRRFSPYNVIANNCEHAATFCATTMRAESLQATLLFGLFTLMGMAVTTTGTAPKRAGERQGSRLEAGIEWTLIVLGLVGSLAARFHNYRHRRYWRRIGEEWRQVELALPHRFDPGDHLMAADEHRVNHGIYVDDDRVIRFSRSYPRARGPALEAVSLASFEVEDEVTAIVEPPRPSSGRKLGRLNSPETIVARAESLLADHPDVRFPSEASRRQALTWCIAGAAEDRFQPRRG